MNGPYEANVSAVESSMALSGGEGPDLLQICLLVFRTTLVNIVIDAGKDVYTMLVPDDARDAYICCS